MEDHEIRTDIPVALLHEVGPGWTDEEIEESAGHVRSLAQAMQEIGHPVASVPVHDDDIVTALLSYDPLEWIVLNWVEELPGIEHGDAHAARQLRRGGYTYTGSPPEVLELSYDKVRCKRLLMQAGIPTPPGRMFERACEDGWTDFPAIVKPAFSHCSTGITNDSVVMDARHLARRIAHMIRRYKKPVLVEPFVDGREFHVSLWGNGRIEMLPPAEMDFSAFDDPRDRLCTWDSKYLPGSRHFEGITVQLPAALDQDELHALERVSRAAAQALGCRDYARIDLRLQDGEFFVLDVNPNPDITADTSFALAAGIDGQSYGRMGSRLVNLAALRHPSFRPSSGSGAN